MENGNVEVEMEMELRNQAKVQNVQSRKHNSIHTQTDTHTHADKCAPKCVLRYMHMHVQSNFGKITTFAKKNFEFLRSPEI